MDASAYVGGMLGRDVASVHFKLCNRNLRMDNLRHKLYFKQQCGELVYPKGPRTCSAMSSTIHRKLLYEVEHHLEHGSRKVRYKFLYETARI